MGLYNHYLNNTYNEKTSLSILLALISWVAFAQQSLWGGQNIVSPEIHPDNRVTFRFLLQKPFKVQVTGDFLPPQKIETQYGKMDIPGVADLKEGEKGVWEYTTPEPLASELYNYTFIVDGLKNVIDPNNVYVNRDVASLFNIFIIKGGCGDLYSVNKVPHGSVTQCWYNSPSLGYDRRITIIRLRDMKLAENVIRYFISCTVWVAMKKLGLR